MRLMINHMTRMHGGHICLAGVDLETRRHVRPILANDPMPFYLLARYGGPFDMARVVDLGSPRHQPVPPHVEDYVFVPARAKSDRPAASHEFWRLQSEVLAENLHDLFGPTLEEVGRHRWSTPLGQGLRTLGVLRPTGRPELYLAPSRNGGKRIRMKFSDGRVEADAGVTDLRLFGDDHATPDAARVCAAAQAIVDSREVLLSVGLTRKFRVSEQHDYRHWLQVNNIHLRESPIWTLGS